MSLFRRFRCYLDRPPARHGPLRHPPPSGVSRFRRFRCYLDRPHAPHGSLPHPPPPGVSLFRCFRCYLDRPHAPHGSLPHPPLPGVSLFWRFRCYLDRPHARHGPPRHPPLPGVSRFRRIGSHLRRVTRASPPGTMAAGAREQAASCDAFVLSRRQPAPDAPLKRGISFAKTRRFRAADYSPRPAPVRGTFAVAWNIAVRTRGVFTHRTGFQKPACVERGLVRTGWRCGEAAGGNRWRKRISAGAGVSKQGQAQV